MTYFWYFLILNVDLFFFFSSYFSLFNFTLFIYLLRWEAWCKSDKHDDVLEISIITDVRINWLVHIQRGLNQKEIQLNLYNKLSILIVSHLFAYSAQKMRFSNKDFFSKCDQILKKLQIWLYLLKKSLMENFIFLAVLMILNHGEQEHAVTFMKCLASSISFLFLPKI